MSDIAIKVENFSKRYRIGMEEEVHDTLMGSFVAFLKSPYSNFRELTKLTSFKNHEESKDIIWALRNVSFEVEKGEVLGIIGGNGAGKTTLLKLLSRITRPTSGRAIVAGRVASLLEVGTGFHPELTGRENIFVNGAILGMTKREIEKKFDEIIHFSGVEKFIDTPVKRYSSGMRVRLAFSVAAHLEPEILMIDEVLAVGDIEFQKKCLGKMDSVAKEGRTVLFVSHNMGAIKSLCTRAIVIDNGRLEFDDIPYKSINHYVEKSKQSEKLALIDRRDRMGNQKLKFTSICLINSNEEITDTVLSGDKLIIEAKYKLYTEEIKNVYIQINIIDPFGQVLFSCSTDIKNQNRSSINKNGAFRCIVPRLPLSENKYTLFISCKEDRYTHLDRIENAMSFNVLKGDFYNTGRINFKNTGHFLVDYNWEFIENE